jgi:hypothetical protein
MELTVDDVSIGVLQYTDSVLLAHSQTLVTTFRNSALGEYMRCKRLWGAFKANSSTFTTLLSI